MLPGVSPGKNTPQVTEFITDPEKIKKYDKLETLLQGKTMTEKVRFINEKYVLHVRPVSFFSKCFAPSQIKNYTVMQKEMYALVLSITNFRDYMAAVPITFVLTDSQPICWALRHKDDNLMLSRWVCKLYETKVDFLVTHVRGLKMSSLIFYLVFTLWRNH
jgi:hypothetical protein